MGKKIIVNIFLSNVVPQRSGSPQKNLVNQKVDIAQKIHIYQVLLAILMYLAKTVKHGIRHVICAFVLIILSGMERNVFPVQEERSGELEKDANAVKDNFSLVQDVKLLTI